MRPGTHKPTKLRSESVVAPWIMQHECPLSQPKGKPDKRTSRWPTPPTRPGDLGDSAERYELGLRKEKGGFDLRVLWGITAMNGIALDVGAIEGADRAFGSFL